MKYYAKLDTTNHINTIYLESQLTDTNGYTLVQIPDAWLSSFIQDWTNFYIKSDGSLDFDNNKATQTQQSIDTLTASVNALMVELASVKGAK